MAVIVSPEERECERCGRRDRWDPSAETWRIAVVDDEKRVGNPHCLHEWDINGAFNPIQS
mgnify:CR=1 FL=1